MSSISEASSDGPRVLKGTPFQQHYQILNFHERRLARVERRLAAGDNDSGEKATNDQQIKMLLQHIQQLSRRVTQMEGLCRTIERRTQTVEIGIGQLTTRVDTLSTAGGDTTAVGDEATMAAAGKQKGRKKKGKNVRLEVNEN